MAVNYPHAMPTPPFSPEIDATPPHMDSPLKSTINLLDSLVAFYQQERMWVYRTRASLEEAFQDPPSSTGSTSGQPGDTAFTLPSPSSLAPPVEVESALAKTEPPSGSPHTSPTQPPTRWLRRKKGFKLKLDGIGPRNKRTLSSQPGNQTDQYHSPDAPNSQSGVRILEMFENMMEARMESCQRVNRLVRKANRADLHAR
jgi:hypothetical protein